MLIAGLIACCFGVLEFYLNTQLYPAVFAGSYKKTLLMLFSKLAAYGLGLGLLFAFFRAYLVGAAIGFGAGFLCSLIFYGVRAIVRKDG